MFEKIVLLLIGAEWKEIQTMEKNRPVTRLHLVKKEPLRVEEQEKSSVLEFRLPIPSISGPFTPQAARGICER